MERIEITREEYTRMTGWPPDRYSIGAMLYDTNGTPVTEYIFSDEGDYPSLKRLGRSICEEKWNMPVIPGDFIEQIAELERLYDLESGGNNALPTSPAV